MGLRSVVLKLHKPGKAKQKVIDDALVNYNAALQFLINKASTCLPELEERFGRKSGGINILALSKWVDGDTCRELNNYAVQPFKDSLRLEFGGIVESCLRLGKTLPDLSDPARLRPVYFCRYDTKRSYCLLYNREKDRYYAKLYLLNGANARKIPVGSGYGGKLAHIHKDGSTLERTGRREAFIIVPLSFGKWQEKILKEASKAPESFRTARLLVKNGEYYLAVSIESGETENIKTSTYMGVSRGMKSKLNYTVVDHAGEILSQGPVHIKGEYRDTSGIPVNELHESANFIADIAVLYKSQVVVQDLSQKGDGLSWIEDGQDGGRPEYRCRDYNQLTGLLEYKLPWKGLPKPVKVSPVRTFNTCMYCGLSSKGNRPGKDIFICTGCGTAMDIDSLGSLNLAGRLISYNSSGIRISVSKNDKGVVFTNKILGLDCFSGYDENQMERLRYEIEKIIESTEKSNKNSNGRARGARTGMVRKLRSVDNFMDLIEFI